MVQCRVRSIWRNRLAICSSSNTISSGQKLREIYDNCHLKLRRDIFIQAADGVTTQQTYCVNIYASSESTNWMSSTWNVCHFNSSWFDDIEESIVAIWRNSHCDQRVVVGARGHRTFSATINGTRWTPAASRWGWGREQKNTFLMFWLIIAIVE